MTAQVLTTGDRRTIRVAPLTREQARPAELETYGDQIRALLGHPVQTPPLEVVR